MEYWDKSRISEKLNQISSPATKKRPTLNLKHSSPAWFILCQSMAKPKAKSSSSGSFYYCGPTWKMKTRPWKNSYYDESGNVRNNRNKMKWEWGPAMWEISLCYSTNAKFGNALFWAVTWHVMFEFKGDAFGFIIIMNGPLHEDYYWRQREIKIIQVCSMH